MDILTVFLFSIFCQAADLSPSLAEKYQNWIEQEVVYIISPKEKEVFLQLRLDKEREIFIEAFWKQRDPLPGTPENEFRAEHYRRLEYANKTFGPASPGWKTDRGRIHIILGPPLNIQRFVSFTRVYPTEIWYYQQDFDGQLPPFFYVVFFDRRGLGEYVLYSPVADGPQNLLIGEQDHPLNLTAAYEKLYEYDATLARVSVSLIPGESANTPTPSLASDLLIQRIAQVAQRKVKDLYAQKYLEFKDSIEVEYSTNYFENDHLVQVITDESGTSFVHYFIRLDRLSVNQYENTFYTTLEINGMVTAEPGGTVYQFEKTYPLKLSPDQFENVKKSSFAIYDVFPLIPGDFKFSLILKNTVSKEFSSLEKDIKIIAGAEPLRMTPPLLAYGVKKGDGSTSSLVPFQIGDRQLLCPSPSVFLKEDNLTVYFQVFGLDEASTKNGRVQFIFSREEKEHSVLSENISDLSGDGRNFLAEFPLKDFPSSDYQLLISLHDQSGQSLVSRAAVFSVSPVERLPRPVIISKTIASSKGSFIDYILGVQHLNRGDAEGAGARLEKAFSENPANLDFALGLTRARYLQKRYGEIEPLLLPFKNETKPHREVLYFLARAAHERGRLESAVKDYEELISHFGFQADILNSLGDCHSRLGHFPEAQAAWKKSLEINPDQPEIKKLFDSIKSQSEKRL